LTFLLRKATAADAAAVRAIYAPHVDGSIVSFEEQVPSVEDMARRIAAVVVRHPWLVAVAPDGAVLGYAYGSTHRERAAYRWTVETSVYVDRAAHRRGVATGLYVALHEILTLQGFTQALAGIALPNPARVALHRGFGYVEVAHYRAVGHNLGRRIDVIWQQRTLADPGRAPDEPMAFPDACRLPDVMRRLRAD
jgi:phosphinothricin acetyltransferase